MVNDASLTYYIAVCTLLFNKNIREEITIEQKNGAKSFFLLLHTTTTNKQKKTYTQRNIKCLII